MSGLDGKVVLISGAAMGQGEAEARLCVERGARVVIGDVAEEQGRTVAASLGSSALFVNLDVTQAAQWAAAVAAAESAYGRLDGLVNNAGISMRLPLAELSVEQITRVWQINQLGPMLGMQHALEPMKRAGGGSIVNIGSAAGLRAAPRVGAYSATKWALRGLTRTVSREFAPFKIRVNIVHPGMIETPMISTLPPDMRETGRASIPLGRVGEASDIAAMVCFLLSDEASFITGAEHTVDGGGSA